MTYVKPDHKKVVSLHVKLTKPQRAWVQEQAIARDMNESEFERWLHDQAMKTSDGGAIVSPADLEGGQNAPRV